MARADLLTAQERAKAAAAINRLEAQAKVNGRFQQVTRRAAQEDSTFSVSVHVHDGPRGQGRTIFVEKQVGTILVRRTQGDGEYGVTADWFESDLSKLITPHKKIDVRAL